MADKEKEKQKDDVEKESRVQGYFIPGEQRSESKKDEDPNMIARAWEAAKESLGLGAWTDKRESRDEKNEKGK